MTITKRDILIAIGEVAAGVKNMSQLGKSLQVYKDRGEFTGGLISAGMCLVRAGYELKNVKVYDAPKFGDRYTVVFLDFPVERPVRGKEYMHLGMNAAPCHPQGIGMHGECKPGKHLGKKIDFAELPEECQRLALDTFFNDCE